jgi:fermentation-respiration switch protein FrsA (DUF1100 family)
MAKVTKQKQKRTFMIIIGIVIIVLIVGYFGISLYIADTLTQSKPNITDNASTFVAKNVQNVTFLTTDGIQLKGWLYKNTNSNTNKRIIIQVAGFTQNRSNDDYYGLFIAHDLFQQGYSILLYDPRDSGMHPLRTDFGQTRGNDVLGAVQFVEKNGYAGQNIGIVSDSLGAVETLMVVDKLENLGPIVIDSGIAQMKPLLELRMSQDHHIPSFLFPGIFLAAKVAYHIDINTINPVDQLAKVPNRVFLFLVGAKDNYVSPENSNELLKAANPASKLVIFPSAGHAHTYRSDPDLYLKTINKFFDQQF